MGNIEIQYPSWYILLCLAIALVLTGLLYYRSKSFPITRSSTKVGLGILRFLTLSLLSFLLLSPVLRYSQQESKRPIVVFAQDVSRSIANETDSQALSDYVRQINALKEELSERFEVLSFNFGDGFREEEIDTFGDKISNQSDVLEYVADLYGDQNLGALIYATDGIFNEGRDPRYAKVNIAAPIYTIAMGDTTPRRDLFVQHVFHNEIAYLGDKAVVQVDVGAYNCPASASVLELYRIDTEGAHLIQSKSFNIEGADFFQTLEVEMEQKDVGLQRFRVVLRSLSNEKSVTNNRSDFFIDVIDARQKILILAASPHPDIAAIKGALEENKNYEVEVVMVEEFDQTLDEYNFVVVHQLPSQKNRAIPLLREINTKKIPRMVVVGSQTNLLSLGQFQKLVTIKRKGRAQNEVQAIENGAFSYFKTSEGFSQNIRSYPPIDAPFADYEIAPGAEVLLSQQIGNIETNFPLLVIGENETGKTAIWCGEGIWKWRLFDFLQNESHQVFDDLLNQIVQYVSLKEDKRKFKVFQTQKLLSENEAALFDAELYNQSYQLTNVPEVTMNVYNVAGEAFTYVFSRRDEGYYLNTGRLPVGDYSWTAITSLDGEDLSVSGHFSIQAIEKESYETVANHDILHFLSDKSGGELLFPQDIGSLRNLLLEDQNLKPLYYQVVQTRSAIHFKWIFFALLLFLTVEWIVRRYLGTY